MPIIRFLGTLILALSLLVGCVALPLPGVGWTLAPVPLSGATNLDLPDYSLGPVSSPEFPDLIRNAIPPDEGEVHLSGKVELALQLDNQLYILGAVAALGDTGIVLLRWYDPEGQYKISARLPYADILSLSMNTMGFGRVVYFCLATPVFAWGDQPYAIDRRASMSFIKPSGMFQDVERTETAIAFLQQKIRPIDGACDTPAEGTDAAVEAVSQ